MALKTLLIDLDETVYPSTTGVWDAIAARMDCYMHERLGIDPAEIPDLRRALFIQYGTTLRGLETIYHIDQHDYLQFVHDVPLDQLIDPDPALRTALQSIPNPRWIFTNADRAHARRVIDRLGLDGCFEGVIDILDIAPYCKPMPESFAIAMRLSGAARPADCIFVDDSPRNLIGARELGFFTIQVGSPKLGLHHPPANPHAAIQRLADLPRALAQLALDDQGHLNLAS